MNTTIRAIEPGDSFTPRKGYAPLPWKVTKVFTAPDGERVFRLEKYQGGRNSPGLLTGKQLWKNFKPTQNTP